ncbi:MAG: CpeR family transcriptional regulator [Cyanobacteria bacterium P01_A01_bin.114]
MLPPEAEKKMQAWIRSRHLIRSGNFFMFETVEYSTIEKFQDCVQALGGTVICVEPTKKIWIGNHRRVVLYQAKASLHTPHHDLQQYWIKYGSFHTRFDERI